MPRKVFDGELQRLHELLSHMCETIEGMINDSVSSLNSLDKELASVVSERDKSVDEMESAVEKECVRLLMKQQPVARDLVTVTTAIKVITDLERIGDQASDIAEMVEEYPAEWGMPKSKAMRQMSDIAVAMVHQATDSFLKASSAGADMVIRTDDELDALLISVNAELIKRIKEDSSTADSSISLLTTAKHLEKIGDYAVNVARWSKYTVTGVHPDKRVHD